MTGRGQARGVGERTKGRRSMSGRSRRAEAALRAARFPLVAVGLTMNRAGATDALRAFVERHRLPVVSHDDGQRATCPRPAGTFVGVVGRARRDIVADFCTAGGPRHRRRLRPGRVQLRGLGPQGRAHRPHRHGAGGPGGHPHAGVRRRRRHPALARAPDRHRAAQPRVGPRRPAGAPAAPRRRAHAAPGALRSASRRRRDARPARPGRHPRRRRRRAHAPGRPSCGIRSGPGNLLVSNGWSSMGFGIPAAIAAKLVCPDRQVVACVGDGGYLMMVGEINTAVRLRLPVVFVVLRDRYLSLIRVKQTRRHFAWSGVQLYGDTYRPSDTLFGAPVVVAETEAAFRSAFAQALSSGRPRRHRSGRGPVGVRRTHLAGCDATRSRHSRGRRGPGRRVRATCEAPPSRSPVRA